jgi:cytidylate kinase
MSVINIAIDGPAGAGKSTIAKAVSAKLGYIYVDTGALYRAVACHMTACRIDAGDSESVEKELAKLDTGYFSLAFKDGAQHVFCGNEDVTGKIRTPEISMAASAVSAIPKVRSFLFELQRSIARENNVIMDGRDIGTVVLPNADVKIFLTASAEERARRRYKELTEKGGECPPYEQVLAEIKQRDHNDMHRETAPLKQAEDAILVDTSDVDLDGAVKMVMECIAANVESHK